MTLSPHGHVFTETDEDLLIFQVRNTLYARSIYGVFMKFYCFICVLWPTFGTFFTELSSNKLLKKY